MYFRTKSIKGSKIVQLVQFYSNIEFLPRQRVIVSLGDAKLTEAEKCLIASAVERRIHGGGDFVDSSLSPEASSWADCIVQLAGRFHAAKPDPQTTVDGVILDSIESTDVVELAPELVALKAREELRFTPMLEALGMNPSASAIATGQLMVFSRLIEPLIDWSHRTELPNTSTSASPKAPRTTSTAPATISWPFARTSSPPCASASMIFFRSAEASFSTMSPSAISRVSARPTPRPNTEKTSNSATTVARLTWASPFTNTDFRSPTRPSKAICPTPKPCPIILARLARQPRSAQKARVFLPRQHHARQPQQVCRLL